MKALTLKLITTLIIIFFLSPKNNFAQLSLDSCQQKALANYPLIQQFGLIDKSKELNISNANKAYLPQFDITVIGGILEGMPSFAPTSTESTSSVNTSLITIGQINQVIWDGGMTKASKGIITASSEIEIADIDVNLYQLEDRINNLYFGVLLIDEQIAQLDLLKETLLRNQKRIQSAIENGTAFKSDADEISVELINIEQKQSELYYNKSAYIKVLSAMIGEEISETAFFERPVFEASVYDLVINRPELSKFENQRNLIEAQTKLNKATLFPKVGLLAFGVFVTPGIEFGTSTLDNLFVGGISLSWSLAPIYKNGNNKKLSQINIQRIENQKETFLFNTNLELNQTAMQLKKYASLIEKDKELLELKKRIKEAYTVKYDNGVATMSQMLDSLNEENLAKQNMITHEIQYLMTAYQFLNKSGN